MKVKRALLITAVMASVTVASFCATPDEQPYDCAKAIRIATAGYSGRKMQPALEGLLPCDAPGADAAARALVSMRVERDTAVLESLTFPLLGWRDPALLRAGMQLAEDPAATPESRVFALRGLYSLVRPGIEAGYSDMIWDTPRPCDGGSHHTDALNETRPVDGGYVDELRLLGSRLANSSANPSAVRRAATCLELIPKGWRAPVP